MNEIEFRDFVSNNRWKFAKTYAKTLPHEYCLREKCVGNIDEAIKYIHKNGTKAKFFRKEYIYLQLDGYYYFTYENEYKNIKECVLINRVNINDYEFRQYGEKLYMYRRQ